MSCALSHPKKEVRSPQVDSRKTAPQQKKGERISGCLVAPPPDRFDYIGLVRGGKTETNWGKEESPVDCKPGCLKKGKALARRPKKHQLPEATQFFRGKAEEEREKNLI